MVPERLTALLDQIKENGGKAQTSPSDGILEEISFNAQATPETRAIAQALQHVLKNLPAGIFDRIDYFKVERASTFKTVIVGFYVGFHGPPYPQMPTLKGAKDSRTLFEEHLRTLFGEQMHLRPSIIAKEILINLIGRDLGLNLSANTRELDYIDIITDPNRAKPQWYSFAITRGGGVAVSCRALEALLKKMEKALKEMDKSAQPIQSKPAPQSKTL